MAKVFLEIACIFLLLNLACCRHMLRFAELEDEDRELLRAAYDAPSYHEEYEQDDDLAAGKVDLLKDGLWAMKAKIKELKAFDKALVANLLSTKLKVKDLIENHLGGIKKHHHEKPYGDQYYGGGQYAAPVQQPYAPPVAPHYAPPVPVAQPYAPPAPPAPAYPQHDPYYGH